MNNLKHLKRKKLLARRAQRAAVLADHRRRAWPDQGHRSCAPIKEQIGIVDDFGNLVPWHGDGAYGIDDGMDECDEFYPRIDFRDGKIIFDAAWGYAPIWSDPPELTLTDKDA